MFTRIHHVGIAVRDLDRALKLYSETLELPVGQTVVFERWGARDVMLPLGDGFMELIGSINPHGPVGRFLERRGEGVYEVSLEVADIQEAERKLRARGLTVMPGVQSNVRFLHPRETHGVLIELIAKGTPLIQG